MWIASVVSTFTNLDLFEKEIQKAVDVEMFLWTMFRNLTFENSPLIGLSQVVMYTNIIHLSETAADSLGYFNQ